MNEQLIGAVLAGIVIYIAIRIFVRAPGTILNKKFVSLGNFTNLSKQDFINKVGKPNAIHNYDDGSQLCQWQATGYNMAIIFDKSGKFVKIHNEIQAGEFLVACCPHF